MKIVKKVSGSLALGVCDASYEADVVVSSDFEVEEVRLTSVSVFDRYDEEIETDVYNERIKEHAANRCLEGLECVDFEREDS